MLWNDVKWGKDESEFKRDIDLNIIISAFLILGLGGHPWEVGKQWGWLNQHWSYSQLSSNRSLFSVTFSSTNNYTICLFWDDYPAVVFGPPYINQTPKSVWGGWRGENPQCNNTTSRYMCLPTPMCLKSVGSSLWTTISSRSSFTSSYFKLMLRSSGWNDKGSHRSHHKSAREWSTGGSFSRHHNHGATQPVCIGRVYVAGQVRRLKVLAADGRWVHLEDAAILVVLFQRDLFIRQDISTLGFRTSTGQSTGWSWQHSMGSLKFRTSHWFTIEMEISRTIT